MSAAYRFFICMCLLLAVAACGKARQNITIAFSPQLAGSAFGCGQPVGGVELTDLRFYVSAPALLDHEGQSVPIDLRNIPRWQSSELALLDLENASAGCANGTAGSHAELIGSVVPGNYRGLQFVLGVPFELNHADPLAASAPLDDSTMHWHWRSGYKFLRAGFRTPNDGFWLHLGSTGCEGSVHNITGCRFPNRVEVLIDDFEPGDTIAFDFAALIASTDLGDARPGDCSSGPAEPACRASFRSLGLDHASGAATGTQQLFQAKKP